MWATPTHDPRITGDSPSRSCVREMTSSCANISALSTESWGDCFIKGQMNGLHSTQCTQIRAMRSRHASTAMHFQSDNEKGVMCLKTAALALLLLLFWHVVGHNLRKIINTDTSSILECDPLSRGLRDKTSHTRRKKYIVARLKNSHRPVIISALVQTTWLWNVFDWI